MEFSELASRRRMTRRFDGRPVDPDLLERLLAECRRAPSAGLAEGVDLLVLTGREPRERFWCLVADPSWRSAPERSAGLMAAPALVVPYGDPDAYVRRYERPDKSGSSLSGLAREAWPVPYWTVDASFVAMSLLLAAANAGLGALFFQLRGNERALAAGFSVPDRLVAIGAVALGYPDADPGGQRPGRRRRPAAEAVHHDRW